MPSYTERPVEVVPVERRRRWTAWIGGFVAALVACAIAVGIFLVVSDDDDDGNVDVPAVDVTIENGNDGE